MPTPTPDRIRTVAVVGHSHDGKTTLCEALLHTAGATQRMGSTEQATSLFDHEPEEQRHSMSIGLSVAHCDWDGYRVNLIDAPGFQDFAGEVIEGLAVADAAVLVVAATGTVPVGAENAWEMIQAAGVPALIVVHRGCAARVVLAQADRGCRPDRDSRRISRVRRPRRRPSPRLRRTRSRDRHVCS